MPVYNGEKYLKEAIESILNQTFKDFEFLIINDGSTDSSIKIIKSFSDSRIILIENNQNMGQSKTLNKGLSLARGEYIARMDQDDISLPDRLLTQVDFLEKNINIDIVGGGYQLFGKEDNRKIFLPSSSIKLAWKFLMNTYLCHPSVMFRRSVLKTIQYYPQTISEDFAFFSKIIQKYRGSNIKKILINYRQHNTNVSTIQSEKINISVRETFLKNFQFYTNSLDGSEIFYNFYFKYKINLKDILKFVKKSFLISQKILKNYNIRKISFEAFNLYFIIILDILTTPIIPYIKYIYKLVKKQVN